MRIASMLLSLFAQKCVMERTESVRGVMKARRQSKPTCGIGSLSLRTITRWVVRCWKVGGQGVDQVVHVCSCKSDLEEACRCPRR